VIRCVAGDNEDVSNALVYLMYVCGCVCVCVYVYIYIYLYIYIYYVER
jgi:hypothetical protein